MIRKSLNKTLRKVVAFTLSIIFIFEGGICNAQAQTQRDKYNSPVYATTDDKEEVHSTELSGLSNMETKKVDVDETSIAQTKIYKDMDYTFLKEYPFGKSNEELATVSFGSVTELKKSNDVRLVSGKVIKTEGYYEKGDGGNAVYEILKENDMNKAKRNEGAIKLANDLYACIIPDICEISGQKWAVVNVLQYGASGNGEISSHAAMSSAFSSLSKHVAKDDDGENLGDVVRGIVYIPSGEYKCANEIGTSDMKNINIVGDGDSSVLFTDNDYRAGIGYGEFFFSTWNAKNIYYGDFRIEAREVDLYHYMRQFVLIYCDNLYMYNVDLIIPQESWSGYYYEDKQYSNFTCYSGNTNVTADGCTFVLFCGTYRGANVGILDFWNRKVENITVMNCDMYSNARDEQIGIFNIPKTGNNINENTSISNIDFINNTIYTTPVKYEEVVGHQNMIFTVAYSDSVRIDDVRIAGNHFICETDSKFMTFGKLTNCVVEDNIIEIITTRNTGASVFDSSNPDASNIVIRNNEFFITSTGNRKKAGMTQGKMTLEGNRVFSDSGMSFGVVGQVARNNEFIFLKRVGFATDGIDLVKNNQFYLYEGAGGGNSNAVFSLTGASGVKDARVMNNIIYDYSYQIGRRGVFQALVNVVDSGGNNRGEFSGNTYYAPNRKYISADNYTTDDPQRADVDWILDENGKIKITDYYNRMYYLRVPDDKSTCRLKELVFKNNTLQGVKGYTHWNNGGNDASARTVQYVLSDNTTLAYSENLDGNEQLTSSVDILYNNKKMTEIAVTGDTVKLDKIVRIATRDEDGNIIKEQEVTDKEIKWYTSVESMATVSEDGKVTRKMYGDVKVYAVPTDGSGIYGMCTIHFIKKKATGISLAKDKIELQPGLKYYADYKVLPITEVSQKLKWTSSNESVATVTENGLITGVTVGQAVITGKTTDGSNISAKLTVDVKPVTAKKMTMNNTWLRYTKEQIGTTKQLEVKTYYPDNAQNKSVKRWESLDPTVATVDSNGKIKIVGSGRVEIRAYSTDEYCYANCFVFVEPNQIENFRVTSVYQNKVDLSWEPVEKSYGYYLYQWDDSESNWVVLNGGKALEKEQTSYTVSNLMADTEYKFCIRAYYTNYLDLGNSPYESKDSIVTVKTYSYNPVTKIKPGSETFTIVDHSWVNQTGEFDISYNSDANYENLDFEYKIADESIVKIVSVEDGSKAGAKKITLAGLKYGATTLTITANDAAHVSVEIPVGFITGKQVTNCKAVPTYKQVAISFDGLEDESKIDGYYICSMITLYKYNLVAYIPKTGASTYNVIDKNVDVGGGSYSGGYKYKICPVVSDGTNYHLGYGRFVNNEGIVQIPEPVKATSLKMQQNKYVVNVGANIEVSAKVGNKDASSSELYWEIIDEKCATIEKINKTNGEALVDYAKVTGKEVGVTNIKAVSTDGSELETSAKLIVTPQSVSIKNAYANLTNVSLSWNKINNVSGYIIYRWSEKEQTFIEIEDLKDCQFADTGLEPNTSYRYKIVAYVYADGTRYSGKSTSEIGITTANSDYGITSIGYVGIYDGKNHKSVELKGVKVNKDSVTYSIDKKNWTKTVPNVKNVKDSKDIYVKIIREGQKNPYEFKVTATVKPCFIGNVDLKLNKDTIVWDGKEHTPQISSSTCVLGKDYIVDGKNVYKDIGVYTVVIKGIGNYTGEINKTFTIKPSLVKGFTYSARSSTAIALKWTKDTNVDGYIIEQYKGGKWVVIKTITNNATVSYKVKGLSPSKANKFRIKSYKKSGDTKLYSGYSIKGIYTLPSGVKNFTYSARSSSAILLKWSKNTSASGYVIEQYKNGKWVAIKTLTKNTSTSYKVKGLSASTANKFRIKAYKSYGSAKLYNVYVSKTINTLPAAVTGFTYSNRTKTSITLKWNKNSKATGYVIEQYKNGKWVKIKAITKNTTVSYKVTGLKKATSYKFRIKSYKSYGKINLYSGYVMKTMRTK